MKKPLLLFFLSSTLVSAGLNRSFAQASPGPAAAQTASAKSSKEAPARQKEKKTSVKRPSGKAVSKNLKPATGRTVKAVNPRKVNSLLFYTMERLETLTALYDNLRLQVSGDTLNKISELDKASIKVAADYFRVEEPVSDRETAQTYPGLLNSALKSVKALKDVKNRVKPDKTEAAIGLCRELNAVIDKELAGTKLIVAAAPVEPPRQKAAKPAVTTVKEPASPVETLNGEAGALSALSELRKAVESYKAAKGKYPTRLSKLTPKYIPEIPAISAANHPTTDKIMEIASTAYDGKLHQAVTDTGKWLYFTNKKSKYYGQVFIDCSHKNAQGVEMYRTGETK